jgi:hypothetical protein
LLKIEDGSLLLSALVPDDCMLPSFAVEQTGGCGSAIFDRPEEIAGI